MSGLRIVLQRLVRRVTIRKPCWVCDKCGWRERHEAEVRCWKCGKRLGGQMIYTPINQKNRAEELLRAKQATEGRTMKPVCPHCGEVDSMDEIDRVAVLQKVKSVTAEGKIELVDEIGEVDWECQYPRDNPPEFECGECGEKCSEDALVKATHKAKS